MRAAVSGKVALDKQKCVAVLDAVCCWVSRTDIWLKVISGYRIPRCLNSQFEN